MRTIIATIKPIHLGNIRSGEKGFEIRKTCPAELPFRVLCCQSGSGGKIIAEFVVDAALQERPGKCPCVVSASCVSMEMAERYAAGKEVWFWHISQMIDYCSTKGYRVRHISEFGLKRAPQSWCYAREGESKNDGIY